MRSTESITNIAPAFVAAQAELEAVSKDASNPFFHSKYADLTSILNTLKPILAKHELAVMQGGVPDDAYSGSSGDSICIKTTLIHSSGEWISDDGMELAAVKSDPQAYGSAVTYARRYALLAFFSLITEDDDGNAASAATTSKVEAAKAAAAARAKAQK